ncbi:MAG: effector-associated constant component EACC1 [Pseudonocardiaceae bacterium]
MVEVRITADGTDADGEALWDWLRHEPELRGRIRRRSLPPPPGGHGFAHRAGRGGHSHRHHRYLRRVAGSVIVDLADSAADPQRRPHDDHGHRDQRPERV